MSLRFAKTLSYLLHPVVYPVLGLLVILKLLPYHTSPRGVILSLAFVFAGTYVLPIALSFLFYKTRMIGSLEMREAKDRKWPYLVGAICYYFTAYLIESLGLPQEAYLYLMASAVVILLHLVLLGFSKPSAHLAGIGGFTGLLIAVSLEYQLGVLPYLALCFILAGFLASARLKLSAHNENELLFGYFSGMVIIFSALILG